MLARAVVLTINFVLLGLTLWGTIQQIETQKSTNKIMAEVHQNIKKARALTVTTNRQLQPLRETADTIETMNGKLDRTNQMLTHMNQSLNRVTISEQKIVTGLDQLNQNTYVVLNQINRLQGVNGQLIPPSSTVAKQTQGEHELMTSLYELTGTSIQEIAKLNRKFAWVGLLPLP
ncbi:hypothetical protein JQC72_16290 [Polycladomyces sp. WAk]|uniref:Uncharacterized protein n=1 Tax=Polycladomyces zharkentensis TaxID=2807616 RepID=A0ABS2WNE9_9BACL|nr:hypothetical protein [Polycladomyces sp. WAk]MBN2911053.1 hypothetical protein [Polycladomyces sp. WAk]